ncbi:NTP transferase domain-containing protein [Roseospira marina]|uniref:NTP transferase domain-containing protein n=1 Tax=Roseospira marina TaxID=140057 RepID=A0A5M6I789_9PROT|nr:nucleotidyltransferase family protein [Roseospira marina]KAA5604066.1 NTP transferase domain-containing protein [Roseospira marina]MBB4315861.1 CTP:molybdopterin cytidylyltransferase MocA [Roseospira marina]MBB5088999.1 CTP:molybdopterin cytidylyltransferase MocA [Roseospira marina]
MSPEHAPTITAIVLAGSRGPSDPVAAAAGVSHKALAPVAGVPMLARVLDTLASVPRIGRIVVVIERPDLVREHPAFARFQDRLTILPAAPSPSRSVLAALDHDPAPGSYLVTTADHPLLTPAMVEHLWTHQPAEADAAVGLARSETIQAAYPDTRRTYLRFRDGAYSGCNLFVLRTPAARAVVTFWRRVEQDRKKPWRMIRLLGPGLLLAYALGRLTLPTVLAALGRRTGTTLAAVEMPFADAAVDVDRPGDLALAEAILARRAGAASDAQGAV